MATSLLLAKITVLLAGALGVGYFWRRSPRRVHQMWTFVFLTTLALPLIAESLPALRVPAMTTWIQPQSPVSEPASMTNVDAVPDPRAGAPEPAVVEPPLQVGGKAPAASASLRRVDFRRMALAVWLAGALTALALMLLSLWRVRRLMDMATEISDPIWRQQAAEIGQRLGFSRQVRLLTSDRIQTPMAGEAWRPTIFLPNGALAWPAECRRAVLGHELAHLAGHDPRRRLVARIMLAIYWFHPLAWLAAYLDAQACEDACDEAVVRELEVRPSAYAAVLLELSHARRLPLAAVALPMARRASLERRLLRILGSSSTASHGTSWRRQDSTSFLVSGSPKPIDDAVLQWQRRMLTLRFSRADVSRTWWQGRQVDSRSAAGSIGRYLVIAEMGLSVILLVGAGLFIASFTRLMRVDLGLDYRNVLTVPAHVRFASFAEREQAIARAAVMLPAVLERVKAIPGIEVAAAIGGGVPLSGGSIRSSMQVRGRATQLLDDVVDIHHVSPDYFTALRIPLLKGRLPSDDTVRSTRLLGGRDPAADGRRHCRPRSGGARDAGRSDDHAQGRVAARS